MYRLQSILPVFLDSVVVSEPSSFSSASFAFFSAFFLSSCSRLLAERRATLKDEEPSSSVSSAIRSMFCAFSSS